MTKKRPVPREFEITEQPHSVDAKTDAAGKEVWRTLREEVERLEQQAAEAEASLRKASQLNDSAKRRFLLDLIESVMDNLDRVLVDGDEGEEDAATQQWLKRFERVRRLVERSLAKEQVAPIDLVSAPPGLVTVDDFEERDDVPDGSVVKVYCRGYLWRGEILRKAKVRVARNSSSDGESGNENLGNIGERT